MKCCIAMFCCSLAMKDGHKSWIYSSLLKGYTVATAALRAGFEVTSHCSWCAPPSTDTPWFEQQQLTRCVRPRHPPHVSDPLLFSYRRDTTHIHCRFTNEMQRRGITLSSDFIIVEWQNVKQLLWVQSDFTQHMLEALWMWSMGEFLISENPYSKSQPLRIAVP